MEGFTALSKTLKQLATKNEVKATKVEGDFMRGYCQGKADAYTLAALWVVEMMELEEKYEKVK